MPLHEQDLQRTRAARRLHVAKVPGGTTPQELSVFFNALMRATGRTAVPSTNDPIISCTVRAQSDRSSLVCSFSTSARCCQMGQYCTGGLTGKSSYMYTLNDTTSSHSPARTRIN